MTVTYREHELPNGLRISAEIDPAAETAAAGFFVRSGARDEPSEYMGISHFLEHMVFKGTQDRSGEAFDEAFDELGLHHNAWTSHEITAFHAHGLPGVLSNGIDLLSELMQPALRDDDLEDERHVIIEEIAMYEDQPFWQLWERVSGEYFGNHPMGHRVLGTVETVNAITPSVMRDWHAHRYGADGMVLAVAGQLDFEDVVSQIVDRCGHWPRTSVSRSAHEMSHSDGEFTMTSDRVSGAYLMTIAPAPPLQDARRYPASILTWILGRGDGSRLHWALVDPGHAEEAFAEYDGHDRCGQFASWAVCDPDKVDHVESVLRQTTSELVGSVGQKDLDMARAMIRTGVTMHSELPGGRMQRLGRMLTTIGQHTSLDEELERINAVTLDDLRSTAADWPLRPVITGRLLPS